MGLLHARSMGMAVLGLSLTLGWMPVTMGAGYLSPTAIVANPTGDGLFVADATANKLYLVDAASGKIKKEGALEASPQSLSMAPDGRMLFVTAGGVDGKVYVVDIADLSVHATLSPGHTPVAAVATPDYKALYVCNEFNNNVAVYPAHQMEPSAKIAVSREPVAAAPTPDSHWLLVANLLPSGAADGAYTAAYVSMIDTAQGTMAANVQLPNGSSSLRGICVSPDGKYAYVTHILSRYQLPTTQLERGWMNTNALSIVDIEKKTLLNTVLLDSVDQGAANPWAVACTADGALLCVTHAGTHELSVIDRPALHAKLDKLAGGEAVSEVSQKPEDVPNDLSFLVDIRRRIHLDGNGPRALAIIGKKAYVANYFSGNISVVDLENVARPLLAAISLGDEPQADPVRFGEQLFHDATLCFQKWQSCSSCHPGIRTDALNWDLLNDGMGNPKNTKSMLFAHATPPAMMSGVRESGEAAVRAGIRHILFAVRPDEEALALDEFLKSLKPVPSPYLVNGSPTEAAKRGRAAFEKAECGQCHSGQYFTDKNEYDVGTAKGLDAGKKYDTPALREIWRTAPYLNDGRAATLKDVLTTFNPEDKHGITKSLSEAEISDLVEYLLTL